MAVIALAYAGLQKLFFEGEEDLNEARKAMFVQGDPNTVALAPHPAFAERADYFESGGIFRVNAGQFAQELGTIPDYGSFKMLLAEKIAQRKLGDIFEEPRPGVFFELLYLKEEGYTPIFGPNTCEKLAGDFASHVNEAEKIGAGFYKIFSRLHKCFNHAQKTGAVALSYR